MQWTVEVGTQKLFVGWIYEITYPPGSSSDKNRMFKVGSGLFMGHGQSGVEAGPVIVLAENLTAVYLPFSGADRCLCS